MSSRVRESKRSWISGLERTVSGILTTGQSKFKSECCRLFCFEGIVVDSTPFDKPVGCLQGIMRVEKEVLMLVR